MSEPQPPSCLSQLLDLYRQGRHADVAALAEQALKADPDDGFMWKALGVAFGALGRGADALAAKERAARLLPRDVEAWGNLANALVQAGRFDDAARCREHICKLQPGSAAAFNTWGNALREAHRMDEAKAAYERCLAIDPREAVALNNLANTLADLGRPAEAEVRYREALALQPATAGIHNNLGNLRKAHGRYAEALACFREALRLQPDFAAAHTNYLLAMNHVPEASPARMFAAAQDYGRWTSARAGAPLFRATHDASRPVRVGFVSGDFRSHPVGHFLESVVAQWPRERVQLFAYPSYLMEDDVTRRMRPHFERWTPIANLDDAKAAARIAEDGVDVLVDLAGHTAHNRLPMFAWRPARVQATWLGYFATTGVEQMDWLLSDAASIAPEDERWFTERIRRLPGTRMCFTPPREAGAVAPLPALAGGAPTFGSFQNLGKINDGVLALWARVLHAVPGARLRVQNVQLGEDATQRAFRERLAAHGIDAARVTLHGKQSRPAYLRAHAQIDVLLDTFPYPGGTTTCEALWMGVPTIALAGSTMLSRQGESLLAAAGLRGWIARDGDDYVRIAVERTADLPALAQFRSGLRDRLTASALFDAKRFARELADAFVAMSAAHAPHQ